MTQKKLLEAIESDDLAAVRKLLAKGTKPSRGPAEDADHGLQSKGSTQGCEGRLGEGRDKRKGAKHEAKHRGPKHSGPWVAPTLRLTGAGQFKHLAHYGIILVPTPRQWLEPGHVEPAVDQAIIAQMHAYDLSEHHEIRQSGQLHDLC